MKIDLHCHTKATKKGDGNGRNVTPELFAEKVANSGVKILAITNHNHFDKTQYNTLKNSVRDYCQVWPGVEIDIQGQTKWHLIVVANPDRINIFSSRVNKLFQNKDLDKCTLTIEEVYKALNACDIIYIPHYHKSPEIKEADKSKLEKLVNDDSRIFLELSNHRSLGVYTNYGFRSIIGSDVKDWSTYDQCTFAELKLPVDSFHQFCLLAKRDKTIVETLLNKKDSIELTAKPHKSVSLKIRLYQDINIIFGHKGTGKSEILKSLYADMISRGLSCVQYIANEKKDNFKALTSTSSMDRDLKKVHTEPYEDRFQVIMRWNDSTPTAFNSYISWYQTKNASANKRRMQITESSTLAYVKPLDYHNHELDKSAIDIAIAKIQSINTKEYINSEDEIALDNLLYILQRKIHAKRKEDLIDKYSTDLTNTTIKSIKRNADKCSDTVSKPSSTGLIDFVQKRMNLYNAVNEIICAMQAPPIIEKEKIGTLEDKGDIYVASRYKFVDSYSYASEVEKKYGYQNLLDIVNHLMDLKNNIFCDDINIKVQYIRDKLIELNINSLKPFLGIKKYICDCNGNEYQPSDGEESIILLQRALHKDADAYFLDEPELGMGNSYIDATIRPLITNLAKSRKYVVIATHNANIAVRTLPYMSIFRAHDAGVYSTYCGNPFNDTLVNLTNKNDVKSWATESMHTLEGGTEAFYERKEIYESKNN